MTGLLGLFPLLQEPAEAAVEVVAEVAASVPVESLTVQAAAAFLIPILVQFLKRSIPAMEGRSLFYMNMVLNMATATAVMMGLDVPAAEALGIGFAGGLAGSKMVDVTKRQSVVVSTRHRK